MFGSLIPEKVAGKIVLCDRGTNVRLPLLQLRDAQTEGACTAAKYPAYAGWRRRTCTGACTRRGVGRERPPRSCEVLEHLGRRVVLLLLLRVHVRGIRHPEKPSASLSPASAVMTRSMRRQASLTSGTCSTILRRGSVAPARPWG